MTIGRIAGPVFVAVTLAACATSGQSNAPAAETSMAGRWILAAPNAPSCGLNFNGAAGARDGTVSPEGGCPGKFFMSRRWSLASGALTIVDEDSQPLATLSYANGQFAGQAATGIPVTLTPPPPPPQ